VGSDDCLQFSCIRESGQGYSEQSIGIYHFVIALPADIVTHHFISVFIIETLNHLLVYKQRGSLFLVGTLVYIKTIL